MGQTILIVEDDKDLRENICSILQNEGFQTTEAQMAHRLWTNFFHLYLWSFWTS